jgi:hypothetical protein
MPTTAVANLYRFGDRTVFDADLDGLAVLSKVDSHQSRSIAGKCDFFGP